MPPKECTSFRPETQATAPWIVFSATGGDQHQTAELARSMVVGSVASLVFVLASWVGFRQGWGFAVTLAIASAIWLVLAALVSWVGSGAR